MRVVTPTLILSVMGVAYGALLAIMPHLAVPRKQAATSKKLLIARLKGVVAFTMGAFMIWRLYF